MVRPRLPLPFLLACLLGLLVVPAAHADYSVWSCRGPAGTTVANAVWTATGAATGSTETDGCATGGPLSAQLGPEVASGATSAWRASIPADVTVTGGRLWITATTAPSEGDVAIAGATQQSPYATDGTTRFTGCATAGCTFPSTPLDPATDPANVTVEGPDVRDLAVLARCTGPEGCFGEPAAAAQLHRSELTVADAEPPLVGALAGTATGVVRGTVSVRAETSDQGGGVAQRLLLVDGQVKQILAGTGSCVAPYTRFSPCPRSQTAAFDLDTTALAEGAHTVAIGAADAGGLATTSEPRTITVDNVADPVTPDPPAEPAPGTPAEPTPTPTPTPTQAVLGTRTSSAPRVPARLRLKRRADLPSKAVSARVFDAADAPVPGALVALLVRPFGADEDDAKLVKVVTADANGRLLIDTTGPSRIVRAVVITPGSTASPVDLALVGRRSLTVRGPAKALKNGDTFALTGRVGGTGGSATGRAVLIQAVVRGRWRTVDSVDAGRLGRVRWTYRLQSSRRAADYRFRMVVPRQKGLPWDKTVSRAVVVQVRP